MANLQRISNPFAMMIDPQAVLAALEKSDRLQRLQRRVCRPLDRPLLAKVDSTELSDYDRAIDDGCDPGALDEDEDQA